MDILFTNHAEQKALLLITLASVTELQAKAQEATQQAQSYPFQSELHAAYHGKAKEYKHAAETALALAKKLQRFKPDGQVISKFIPFKR